MSAESIYVLLPELVLVATATAIYVGGTFAASRRLWTYLALIGIALAAGSLAFGDRLVGANPAAAQGVDPAETHGPLALDVAGDADALSVYVRWLALLIGVALVLITSSSEGTDSEPEVTGTLLVAIAGLMLVGAASELVLLFLGLELISIPTYVLLYLGRQDSGSRESAAKYFFLSILSSAVTLYGFSFLYGAGRSTELEVIQSTLSMHASPTLDLAAVALVLIFAGLAFKISAVPFHFYAPDVYQGTTNGNAAVLAVLPKVAGFVALARIIVVAMPGLEVLGWRIALILSVLTMTVGNVLALWQNNIRRLLAYSSIAHAGYMLIGLAASAASAQQDDRSVLLNGMAAMLFYLAVYAVAVTGSFAALAYLSGERGRIDKVDELAGLGRSDPLTALAIAIFMFSLAGLPPFAGFWGKLTLFSSAWGVEGSGTKNLLQICFKSLAVVGALNAAVAAAYYLRIVATIYFRQPATIAVEGIARDGSPGRKGSRQILTAVFMCALIVVTVGLYPGPLLTSSNAASQVTLRRAVLATTAQPFDKLRPRWQTTQRSKAVTDASISDKRIGPRQAARVGR